MLTKVCKSCQLELPATTECFYKKERGLYGLYSWCKKCHDKRTYSNKLKHPDKTRELNKQACRRWAKSHPDKCREKDHYRRSIIRGLESGFKSEDWYRALDWFHGACAYCGNSPSFFDISKVLHQEHHIPVIKGGGYTKSNIIPACQSCNFSKGQIDPVEWLAIKFGKRKAKQIDRRIRMYFNEVNK
jgi:hypothetical protein